MPMNLGPMELGIIAVVVLMVFGAGKLPKVAGQIGEGIKNMRKGLNGEDINEGESI